MHKYMKKHKVLAKMHPKGPDEWTAKDASMARLKELEIPPFPSSQLASNFQGTAPAEQPENSQKLEIKHELECSDAAVDSTVVDGATGTDCNDSGSNEFENK